MTIWRCLPGGGSAIDALPNGDVVDVVDIPRVLALLTDRFP
jgi:hypothetical protein